MALDVPTSEGIIIWLWIFAIFPFKRIWFEAMMLGFRFAGFGGEAEDGWGATESLGYMTFDD